MSNVTTTSVTKAQISRLRSEAGAAGDAKMVRICDAALEGGEESSEWRECARVIADAVAQAVAS